MGNTVRLTIFLKHDQTKNTDQMDDVLYAQGFWGKFPPEGTKIISWQVMMGIGHVITLEMPPDFVRPVNEAIEKMAGGIFRTEFYLTYDFIPLLQEKRDTAKRREGYISEL